MEVHSGKRAKLEVERDLPLSAQQENRKAVPSIAVGIKQFASPGFFTHQR